VIVIAAIAAAAVAAAGPQPVPAAAQPATLTAPSLAVAPEDTVPDAAVAIRDAFQAAQSLRGSLDGRWRLSDLGGRPLLIFQLTDPGTANVGGDPADSTIEGAWRDPNRAGATDSSGFLDRVDRRKDSLSIHFSPRDGDPPIEVTLHPAADGGWRGELSTEDEQLRVVMAPF
jgi:hypothetical protein